jgi:endonuclease-3
LPEEKMGSVTRTQQFTKVFRVLRKHYKPVPLETQRSVLEHLLFACLLEDASYEAAQEAFAAVVHTFCDWNEVRVTSITELSEVMAALPDPPAAAHRLKRILQNIFETTYSFDLEHHKKKNLGPTIKWLEKLDGSTPFVVGYTVQAGLGGHSIPIDTGTMRVLRLLELVTDKDVAARVVPGLERAIPKSKGIEFGSLLHQLGAQFAANPYSPKVREILLELNPDIADRLPKRRAPRPPSVSEQAGAGEAAPVAKGEPRAAKKKPAETSATSTKPAGPAKPAAEKTPPAAAAPPGRKSTGPPPRTPESTKQPPAQKAMKKSPTTGLSKKKPR